MNKIIVGYRYEGESTLHKREATHVWGIGNDLHVQDRTESEETAVFENVAYWTLFVNPPEKVEFRARFSGAGGSREPNQ